MSDDDWSEFKKIKFPFSAYKFFPTLVDLKNEGYLYTACSNPTYFVLGIVLVIVLVIIHRSTLAVQDSLHFQESLRLGNEYAD